MSGIKFLLDTNVAIGLMKGEVAAIGLRTCLDIPTVGNFLSQVSRIELLGFPGLSADDEVRVQQFLSFCSVV